MVFPTIAESYFKIKFEIIIKTLSLPFLSSPHILLYTLFLIHGIFFAVIAGIFVYV